MSVLFIICSIKVPKVVFSYSNLLAFIWWGGGVVYWLCVF